MINKNKKTIMEVSEGLQGSTIDNPNQNEIAQLVIGLRYDCFDVLEDIDKNNTPYNVLEIPKELRDNEWEVDLTVIYDQINKTLQDTLANGRFTEIEIKEISNTLKWAGNELMVFDKEHPLPNYHDAVNHCIGGINPIIQTLISANASKDTICDAIIAQSFHDLGYGITVESHDKEYRTKLGLDKILHEDRSIISTIKILKNCGFDEKRISRIIYMINSTKYSNNAKAINSGQLLYKDKKGNDTTIDITTDPNKDEVSLASRTLASFDMSKIENNFELVTGELNKEFLGDMLFNMDLQGLAKNPQYQDCYEIIQRVYAHKGYDSDDPIIKTPTIQKHINETEPSIHEMIQAIEKIKSYVDESGNQIFEFDPLCPSMSHQISGTSLFAKKIVLARIEEMDIWKHLDEYFHGAENNPYRKKYDKNISTMKEYETAINEILKNDGNEMTVTEFDRKVINLVHAKKEDIHKFFSSSYLGKQFTNISQPNTAFLN